MLIFVVLNGYSVNATGESLTGILSRPEVHSVEADTVHFIDDVPHEVNERNATKRDDVLVEPQGCERKPIDVYVLSTGVDTRWDGCLAAKSFGIATFAGGGLLDVIGLGTALAGLVVAGQCDRVRALGVKVVSDDQIVPAARLIAALEYAAAAAQINGNPALILMPLTFPFTPAMNEIFMKTVAKGLHVVAAAGNLARDVRWSSPPSVDEVITIGAIDGRDNKFASFSNQGRLIKGFAPGVRVQTLGIGGPGARASWSGTGVAAAQAACVGASALDRYGPMKPAALQLLLKIHAEKDVWGQPPDTTASRIRRWF
ncbi:peptidase S8/S53 domain-containing protein [Cantharellus anzutake]|uniref:peptidase S8/S53 domain-containing protein n=1 Tax=Cantharellus anzutake TaxID=1750568 RepID=UPI001904A776|nr:peptidase S8/S53 domain-containing protein [Cantharellus anzutake]KAF8343821.1 peptidase S8/S53 domain-containing protein [Cantharellus anzutake]